jgi:hypothetical protein
MEIGLGIPKSSQFVRAQAVTRVLCASAAPVMGSISPPTNSNGITYEFSSTRDTLFLLHTRKHRTPVRLRLARHPSLFHVVLQLVAVSVTVAMECGIVDCPRKEGSPTTPNADAKPNFEMTTTPTLSQTHHPKHTNRQTIIRLPSEFLLNVTNPKSPA